MDKHQSVIESIQKLLALNVSDSEIAENLFDVGISKDEATSLIIEAKGVNPTPVQIQGTFTVKSSSSNNSTVQNNSSQQTSNPSIQNKSSTISLQNSSSTIKVPNQDLNQKGSKQVFVGNATKLSMNDEVISQIPFDKPKSDKIAPKIDSASSEDVAGRIIRDVARQSDPNEVGDEIKEDSNDEIENSLNDSESDNGSESENESGNGSENEVKPNVTNDSLINKTSGINDEESEDEFETKVKETLTSEKNNTATNKPNTEKLNLNNSVNSTTAPDPYSFLNVKSKNNLNQNFSNQNNLNSVNSNFSSQSSIPLKKYSPSISLDSSPDFEELWKKGIVVAVNAKLSEMKQLKSDVDLEISQKVDEALRKELYQFKVLADSQKDLLISSNKEALDQKQKEITFIIDAKIAELKQYNKQLTETLKIIEESKKQQQISFNEITLALNEAKKTKSQLIVEVNSEMIKTKSQAQSFIDSASIQIQQMDERVNKTLELEKNIAEGMLAQAEQKIEQLAISRADELISKMEVELNKLQSINKKISPELLDQKIQTIEKFKQEFINNMQTNLAQINVAIEELNRKNEFAQNTLEEKTLAIDAKMEELTRFEKQFTQIMDTILSKS